MIVHFLLLLQITTPQGSLPEVVTRSRLDRSRSVDFHALVTPDTVYVGQQATYQLGVFIDQETRQRIRRNPEFVPPESHGLLSYDLPDRGATSTSVIGGRPYEVHVFRRALFALTPGRYVVPPARLTWALPQNPSFFSREESFAMRSESVTLVAVDPPVAGRPPDWAGAVGVWQATARLDTIRARAGDPFVVTLRLEGRGNVALLPRPALQVAWATVVPADERVVLDSAVSGMRGHKEFDWLVTAREAGLQQLPSVRYPYFNPFARRFEVALTPPITVRTLPGDVAAVERPGEIEPAVAPLTLRAALGAEAPAPLGDSDFVRWLLLLAPLPALFAWIVRLPPRASPPPTPLKQLHALVESVATAADVRRTLQAVIRARTNLDPSLLTAPDAWRRALRLEGVADDTAHDAELLLSALDAATFAAPPADVPDLALRAETLFQKVDREARRQGGRGRLAPFLVAALLAGAASLGARDVGRAREPFGRGLAAYSGADFAGSTRFFADAAREAPRAAAAWANFGTASWALHDTASAVAGWQRALRLDPVAGDLRVRLALVRAPQDVGFARVPAFPARLPSVLALLVWCAGWAAVARQFWRRHPALPLALATVLLAGSVGVAARLFEDRLEGRDLAVVADPAPLRTVPVLEDAGNSIPLVGEIARVQRRQGVWTRVVLDGDRAGWLATERLTPLGRD